MQQKEKAKQLKIEAMQQKVKKSYDQEGGSFFWGGEISYLRKKNPNFWRKAKSLESLIFPSKPKNPNFLSESVSPFFF